MLENFNRVGARQRIITRASANNFFVPRVEKEASKTFYFNAIRNWNSLPDFIKVIEHENAFKEKLKLHISKAARDREHSLFV